MKKEKGPNETSKREEEVGAAKHSAAPVATEFQSPYAFQSIFHFSFILLPFFFSSTSRKSICCLKVSTRSTWTRRRSPAFRTRLECLPIRRERVASKR